MKLTFFLKKGFFVISIYISALLILFLSNGCAKEYSFEGSPFNPQDTIPQPTPVIELPPCAACNFYPEPVNLNQWSLKAQQSQACGIIDTAITDLGRSYFTFFGPSACSSDTGMVITVYLENESLDRDRTNLTVNKVAFYYYDRVTPSYIYITFPTSGFFVHIDSYIHQTKIVSGRFGGSAFRVDGTSAVISSGKFKVRLL